jgi:hypothetical protein
MDEQFIDAAQLAALTGHRVRTGFRMPDEPDELPAADAIVVAPATFNTVNKWAAGIKPDIRAPDLRWSGRNHRPTFPPGGSRTAAPGTGPVAGGLGSLGTHMRGHCGSHDGGAPVMVGRCRAPRPAGRGSPRCAVLWLGVRGWQGRRRPCATRRCR